MHYDADDYRTSRYPRATFSPARRSLLCGIAIASVNAALPGCATIASPVTPGIVDVHHHIAPRFFQEAVSNVAPEWEGWSPASALAEMDGAGVGTAVVSYTQPGVWLGDRERSRDLARRCNDYCADLVRRYPGRFGFFAALPLPDGDASLREIDRALGTLGADGIGLMTSYDDRWLGDPVFAPVFAELDRRAAVVYVHPTSPQCCSSLMSYVPPNLTEFVQDTNRAMTSLMYSGTVARFPRIKFLFSHAGGGIPVLAGRLTEIGTRRPQVAARLPGTVSETLARFHYELANSATPAAFGAVSSIVPSSQLLFGSDYPLFPIAITSRGLDQLNLSPHVAKAILRDNALRLLPRLAG